MVLLIILPVIALNVASISHTRRVRKHTAVTIAGNSWQASIHRITDILNQIDLLRRKLENDPIFSATARDDWATASSVVKLQYCDNLIGYAEPFAGISRIEIMLYQIKFRGTRSMENIDSLENFLQTDEALKALAESEADGIWLGPFQGAESGDKEVGDGGYFLCITGYFKDSNRGEGSLTSVLVCSIPVSELIPPFPDSSGIGSAGLYRDDTLLYKVAGSVQGSTGFGWPDLLTPQFLQAGIKKGELIEADCNPLGLHVVVGIDPPDNEIPLLIPLFSLVVLFSGVFVIFQLWSRK